MTSDGHTYEEWQRARIALAGVSEVFQQQTDAPFEDFVAALNRVPDYQLIPPPVREALENLEVSERQAVNRILLVLAENNFYLEDGIGALVRY